MAIRTLGSYAADPNYQVNSLRNFGLTIAALSNSWRDRQDKQQQRDLQQIRYLLGLAQQEPELASNPQFYGEVTKRYSANFPEVAPLLDTLAKRGEVANQAQAAGKKYLSLQGQYQQAHDALQQQLAASPDTLENGAPNIDRAILKGQLAQVGDPASFPMRALQQMSPEERSGATLFQKMGGYQMPKAFDPFRDMTPEQKTLYAGQTGLLDESSPALQAAQYTAGLKVSPKYVIEQANKAEQASARAKAATDLAKIQFQNAQRGRQETHGFAVQRLNLADKLERGRMAYGVETAGQKYDYSHPEKDPSKVTFKDIQAGVTAAQRDYQARFDQAMRGVKVGQPAAQIKAAFFAQNGPRPAPIPPLDAMVLAQRAEDAGGGDPEATQTTLSGMISNYQVARAAGKSSRDALHVAMPGADPLALPPAPAAGMTAPAKPPEGPGFLSRVGSLLGSLVGGHPGGAAGAGAGGAPQVPGTPSPPAPAPGGNTISASSGPPPAAGQSVVTSLVNATADTVQSHGADYARQILASHYGIHGPQAEDLLRAAQVAAAQRNLARQQSAVGATTAPDESGEAPNSRSPQDLLDEPEE